MTWRSGRSWVWIWSNGGSEGADWFEVWGRRTGADMAAADFVSISDVIGRVKIELRGNGGLIFFIFLTLLKVKPA